MGLLDAADVELLRFEELFKFLLSHPFCIPVHHAKFLMTGSSTPSSPSHQQRVRAAVSGIGLTLLRLRARRRSTLAAAHKNNTTTIQRKLHGHAIVDTETTDFLPAPSWLCHPISAVEVSTQGGLLHKDSCLTGPSYPCLCSLFPSHRRFVFQDLRAPSARLL